MRPRSTSYARLVTACAVLACSHPSINRSHPDSGAGGIAVGSGSGGSTPGGGGAGGGGAGGGGGSLTTGEGGAGGGATTGAGGDATTGAGGGATTGAGGGGASGGANMIINGDFSNGGSLWVVTNPDMGAGPSASGGYCVTVGSGQYPVLGWPSDVSMAASLRSGASYQISYAASSSGPGGVNLVVKVGQAVAPYQGDFMATDSLTSSPQSFSHTFQAPTDDPQAGVAFEMTGLGAGSTTTVCFDDVTLVAQ
jgi:hypothetical protein